MAEPPPTNALTAAPSTEATTKVAPLNFNGTYKFSMAGIPFGKLHFIAKQNGEAFDLYTKLRVVGVARILSNHKSTSSVKGSAANPIKAARIFELSKKESGEVEGTRITYGQGGVFVKRHLDDTHDLSYRPKVPDEVISANPDPLTFVLVIREKLWGALHQKKQPSDSAETTPQQVRGFAFDGKRLPEAHLTIHARGVITHHGKKTKVVQVGLKRKPAMGYTEKELRKIKERSDGEAMIYFSDDERFVPLLATYDLGFATLKAELEQ